MTQTTITTTPSSENLNLDSEISIIDILTEIQATPKEYWPNLLKLIKIFRESVTLKTKKENQLPQQDKLNKLILFAEHIALKELTKQWLEQGDEQEQTETYEYLSQALEKVSI